MSLADRLMAIQRDTDALGTSANGTGHVQPGCGLTAAGQNEMFHRRHIGGKLVNQLFQFFDLWLPDARDPRTAVASCILLAWAGEVRTEFKESALQISQYIHQRLERLRCACCGNKSQRSVQFINRAIRFDAQCIFIDALATEQVRQPGVASAGVKLHGHKS